MKKFTIIIAMALWFMVAFCSTFDLALAGGCWWDDGRYVLDFLEDTNTSGPYSNLLPYERKELGEKYDGAYTKARIQAEENEKAMIRAQEKINYNSYYDPYSPNYMGGQQ